MRIPILRISGLPSGNPGTKWHLVASPVARHKEYYKGEGGGFPQVRAVVSLMIPCLPIAHSFVHQKCSNYALTNLLFGLCRSMWIIDFLVNIHSSNPKAPTHSFTPEVLQTKERTPTLSSIVFTFGLVIESIKELGGASLQIL